MFDFNCTESAAAVLVDMCKRDSAVREVSCFPTGCCYTPLFSEFLSEFRASLDAMIPTMRSPEYVVWGGLGAPLRPSSTPQEITAYLRKAATDTCLLQHTFSRMLEEDAVGRVYE